MIHNTARLPLPALISPGAADDLRSGKQLVGADGSIVTGTLPEVIQATPTISVSSGGLITASATQSGGIVEGGTKSSTKQLTTQGAKTVTPTTAEQIAVAAGRYVTGDVKVAGDANLKGENIAEGVSIFGVTGTHSGGAPMVMGTVNKKSALATLKLVYTANTGLVETTISAEGIHSISVCANSLLIVGGGNPTATSGGMQKISSISLTGGSAYYISGSFSFMF